MQFRDSIILAFVAGAVAQTYTSCNPMEKTCESDTGLASSSYTVDFTKGASSDWHMTAGSVEYDSQLGATFSISKKGDSPTIQSKWYIFFGSVSFYIRSAPGTGIVSSAILESDDLDEIDWEWLGGAPNNVQTNYFGKGNTTSYDRGTTVGVNDAENTFHKYTIDWTSTSTTWSIDGNIIRTLAYQDAVGGSNYPQTPMNIRVGIWAGGDSDNAQGTIDWAGGVTDYGAGPYKMYLQKIEVQNYNPGSSYTYSDRSGAYTSIKVDGTADQVKQDAEASSSAEQSTTLKTTKSSETTKATTTKLTTTTEDSTKVTTTKATHASAATHVESSEVPSESSEVGSSSLVTSTRATSAEVSGSATTESGTIHTNAANMPVGLSGMGTSMLAAVAAYILL